MVGKVVLNIRWNLFFSSEPFNAIYSLAFAVVVIIILFSTFFPTPRTMCYVNGKFIRMLVQNLLPYMCGYFICTYVRTGKKEREANANEVSE